MKNPKGNRLKHLLLLFLFTSFCGLIVNAQERIVSGNVKDDQGEPAIGATVKVPDTKIGTMTDFDGNFSLQVPDDAQELEFSYIGLSTKKVPITGDSIDFAFGKSNEDVCNHPVVYSCFPYKRQLNEVVVTGTRNETDIRLLPQTVSVIDNRTLREQHRTNVLPTVMQRVPGLFVTSRSLAGYGVSTSAAGGISLRGISGASGQMMVLIDGMPQYNGIYGHPIADSYQTLMTERVEVVRGPASMLYGSNAMGGVVNIVSRDADRFGTHTTLQAGGGSYGTFEAEAATTTRTLRFSSTAAAQYNRSDNHRPHMGFEQYGGYVNLGYDIARFWTLKASADVTHFNASNPGPSDAPLYDADQWITRGVVSARLENNYNWSDFQPSGALSVYSNFGRHKIDDGTTDISSPTQRFFRSKDVLTGVSVYESLRLFRGNRLTAGFDWQHIYGKAWYTSKQTGDVLDVPNKQSGRSYRNEVAGYVDFRQHLLPWFTVDAGVRLDHHSVSGTEWVPQAGLVVQPNGSATLKAMASKGFRNPTMRELYLYPPSNEDLDPERIWSYELAWKHNPVDRLTYGANLYFIKGDNMIQTVNRMNVNTGKVENYGMELEATYRLKKHWHFATNHALLHMKNPVVAAPEYLGNLLADFRNDRWTVNAGLQVVGSLYTATGDDAQKENFCLLNLGATYLVNRYVSLWARGENLLAQRYEVVAGYPMPKATFMGGVSIRF